MKLETYLNAMLRLKNHLHCNHPGCEDRTGRQFHAFRARILREFAIYKNFAEANDFDRSQAWFWTDEWRAKEREVDEYISQGYVQSFDSMKEFLDSLEGNDD